MNNPNFSSSPDNQVQSSEPMQPQPVSPKKDGPHFLVAIIIIVVVGGLLLWYMTGIDFEEYLPISVQRPNGQSSADQDVKELDGVDVGDLDAQFQGIDADLNSL